MANVTRIAVGDLVHSFQTNRWRVAKVTAFSTQSSATLAIVEEDGTRISLGVQTKWNRTKPISGWRRY
jgi:hypothetical protein